MDMSLKANSPPALWRKARHWADKMLWGLQTIGAPAVLRGAARLAYLHIRRPARSELQLRSGQILEFGFPSQLPRALLVFGEYVDPEFSFLRRISRPDWIVVDIGAAIGQFTLFAATLPVAVVHAFEPSAVNVAALSGNVQRNGVSQRVEIHRMALSNMETEASFETTASTWVSRLSDTGAERVPVRRLDAEFERMGLDHVSVLKLNVAGFEPQVLEGADAFLAKGGADILVLLLGLDSLPWYGRIAGYGYRFFYFHPDENALYEVTAFDADSVLSHRPWPARHILAIHQSAMALMIVPPMKLRRIESVLSPA